MEYSLYVPISGFSICTLKFSRSMFDNKPPFFIQPQKFKNNLIHTFSSEIEKEKPKDELTFRYFKNNWGENFKNIFVVNENI